jgi:putative endonuclease
MANTKIYSVYILASLSRALYVGITSNLEQRVWQHKEGVFGGHTSKYKINRLVYHEAFGNVNDAIAREKELKTWLRQKKIELIEKGNPGWDDLSENWGKSA